MRMRHVFLALLLAAPVSVFGASADLQELDRLVADQQYTEAYELARGLLADLAGDPVFDFDYGLAAYGAGHVMDAVLAFERVVLAQPDNHRARLELARAEFSVGDYKRARIEFERVLGVRPPALVAARIQGFLEAIERRQKAVGTGIDGSVSLALGHDSNINSATAVDQILVFGSLFSLDGNSRQIDSWFSEFDATVNVRRPLSKTQGLFGQAGFRHRGNFETGDFNLGIFGLAGGYGFSQGGTQWRFPLQLQLLTLGGEHFRTLGSLGAEWTRVLGAKQEISLFSQIAATDYPDDAARDATLLLAGGAWTYRLADTGGRYALTAFGGREEAREDYNGRRFIAARASVTQPLDEAHSVAASLTVQRATYADEAPVFGLRREDESIELQLSWDWRYRRDWRLRSQLSWTDSHSNLDVYEFDRAQAQIGLAYLF